VIDRRLVRALVIAALALAAGGPAWLIAQVPSAGPSAATIDDGRALWLLELVPRRTEGSPR
jgi:hypothetical protein